MLLPCKGCEIVWVHFLKKQAIFYFRRDAYYAIRHFRLVRVRSCAKNALKLTPLKNAQNATNRLRFSTISRDVIPA